MKLIPLICGKIDFCILPIGDNFTMGIEEAIIAADYVSCDRIVGVHYDTFGYIKIDHGKAKEQFNKNGKDLLLPKIGGTIKL
jgi:L-ascorbate metabolism protein UlaG (beta-lactamase superfamily)